jgi:hypothetical protein
MLKAKTFGWAIYAVGFAIWCFGYVSAGHAPLFNWQLATPVVDFQFHSQPRSRSRDSGYVREHAAEVTLGSLIRLCGPFSPRGRGLRMVVVLGVADLAYDLGRRTRAAPAIALPCPRTGHGALTSADTAAGSLRASGDCVWRAALRGLGSLGDVVAVIRCLVMNNGRGESHLFRDFVERKR